MPSVRVLCLVGEISNAKCIVFFNHHWMQWIARQQMFDIGEHQFLVLLFMLNAKFNQRGGVMRARMVKKPFDALVDCFPISEDFFYSRTREQATLRAWELFTNAVVIGIEQHPERRMVGLKF